MQCSVSKVFNLCYLIEAFVTLLTLLDGLICLSFQKYSLLSKVLFGNLLGLISIESFQPSDAKWLSASLFLSFNSLSLPLPLCLSPLCVCVCVNMCSFGRYFWLFQIQSHHLILFGVFLPTLFNGIFQDAGNVTNAQTEYPLLST